MARGLDSMISGELLMGLIKPGLRVDAARGLYIAQACYNALRHKILHLQDLWVLQRCLPILGQTYTWLP